MTEILTPSHVSLKASLPKRAWQESLKNAIRSGRELCRRLDLAPELCAPEAEDDFPVFVSEEFLSRISPGNPSDPLLRQVLGTSQELSTEGLLDPVDDEAAVRGNGILQKYSGRVLLITTGACAIHCRYCFRRHYPYQSSQLGKTAIQTWLNYIAKDPTIEEVILSGGDPLSVVDETWQEFAAGLNQIPHVQRLRVHTRFPVVIPSRVDSKLLDWLTNLKAAVYLVLHINHAQEMDRSVREMFATLRRAGITLLNQAVLLRGVNDTLQMQADLCRMLINDQVIPYYLHQLDPVRGAMHFQVEDEKARSIIQELRTQLPGYAIPQLVQEVAKQPSKTPL